MHKHAARNDHYDLRLEEDGVLRSWALPKGQYGGGTVMLWDAIVCAVCVIVSIEDRNIRFRILSRKDTQPVSQAMVNPETGEIVPHAEARRAYVAENGDRTFFATAELTTLEPEPSRDIDMIAFLPAEQINHRWYDRPYYLGPDGNSAAYFAFCEAIEASGLEGLARWVMRGKAYIGALRLHLGYPVLVSLRHAEEVVTAAKLEALDPEKSREIDLAQFVDLHALSPLHFERAYFLVPDGRSTKAYRLLAEVLAKEARAGIATFVMRGKEYLCAIIAERGILRAQTLRFADEVRSPATIGLPPRVAADAAAVTQFGKAINALKAKTLDRAELKDQRSASSAGKQPGVRVGKLKSKNKAELIDALAEGS